MQHEIQMYSVTRDLAAAVRVPLDRLVTDILKAAGQDGGQISRELVYRFLSLPRQEGGYGWMTISPDDVDRVCSALEARIRDSLDS